MQTWSIRQAREIYHEQFFGFGERARCNHLNGPLIFKNMYSVYLLQKA